MRPSATLSCPFVDLPSNACIWLSRDDASFTQLPPGFVHYADAMSKRSEKTSEDRASKPTDRPQVDHGSLVARVFNPPPSP